MLKRPAALSLSSGLSVIPSFSLTPSIISESKGTKITEQAIPSKAKPAVEIARFL